jgi:hypothetical protein
MVITGLQVSGADQSCFLHAYVHIKLPEIFQQFLQGKSSQNPVWTESSADL